MKEEEGRDPVEHRDAERFNQVSIDFSKPALG